MLEVANSRLGGLTGVPFLRATSIRLASILIVGVVYLLLPPAWSRPLFVSLLFAHYILAFGYARGQIRALARNSATWPALLFLAGISAVYLGSGLYVVGLVPFIGLHIALSETYMPNHLNSLAARQFQRGMNPPRFALNMALFALLQREHPAFHWAPPLSFHLAVAASLIWFFWNLERRREELGGRVFWDYCLFELAGVGVAYWLLIRFGSLASQAFVFYHIITWVIFPAFDFSRKKARRELGVFLGLVASCTALIFLLQPAFDWGAAIPFWASLHFLSSFALSSWNPPFIARWFYSQLSRA